MERKKGALFMRGKRLKVKGYARTHLTSSLFPLPSLLRRYFSAFLAFRSFFFAFAFLESYFLLYLRIFNQKTGIYENSSVDWSGYER